MYIQMYCMPACCLLGFFYRRVEICCAKKRCAMHVLARLCLALSLHGAWAYACLFIWKLPD